MPQLSSHSLRRGMATSAHRAGADFRGIKRQGSWRHDGTVQGYLLPGPKQAALASHLHGTDMLLIWLIPNSG